MRCCDRGNLVKLKIIESMKTVEQTWVSRAKTKFSNKTDVIFGAINVFLRH